MMAQEHAYSLAAEKLLNFKILIKNRSRLAALKYFLMNRIGFHLKW
jgi:NADH:ubiquinone oxidoreductase subunit D